MVVRNASAMSGRRGRRSSGGSWPWRVLEAADDQERDGQQQEQEREQQERHRPSHAHETSTPRARRWRALGSRGRHGGQSRYGQLAYVREGWPGPSTPIAAFQPLVMSGRGGLRAGRGVGKTAPVASGSLASEVRGHDAAFMSSKRAGSSSPSARRSGPRRSRGTPATAWRRSDAGRRR